MMIKTAEIENRRILKQKRLKQQKLQNQENKELSI